MHLALRKLQRKMVSFANGARLSPKFAAHTHRSTSHLQQFCRIALLQKQFWFYSVPQCGIDLDDDGIAKFTRWKSNSRMWSPAATARAVGRTKGWKTTGQSKRKLRNGKRKALAMNIDLHQFRPRFTRLAGWFKTRVESTSCCIENSTPNQNTQIGTGSMTFDELFRVFRLTEQCRKQTPPEGRRNFLMLFSLMNSIFDYSVIRFLSERANGSPAKRGR